MSYLVTAGKLDHINLAPGEIEEILQNVAVIISTPQCSVSLERGTGLPMRFLDKPMNIAQAMAVAEITEAVSEQEPRASIVEITFEIDEASPGKLIPTVEVEIVNE